ncbi:unnamed protein product, partial [Musa textilis]
MKFFVNGKQVILKGRRGSKITTVTNHRMEKVLRETHTSFLVPLQCIDQEITGHIPTESIESLLKEFADVFAEPQGLPPLRHHDNQIPIIPGKAPTNIRPIA